MRSAGLRLPLELSCGCAFARRSLRLCKQVQRINEAYGDLQEMGNVFLTSAGEGAWAAHYEAQGVSHLAVVEQLLEYDRLRKRGITIMTMPGDDVHDLYDVPDDGDQERA